MENVINKLKGISSILCTMSECSPGVVWENKALLLLNDEMIECIKKLDEME